MEKTIYEDKILEDIEELLKKHNLDIVSNYWNGEFTFWGMDQKRNISINIIFNHPDIDNVKDFDEAVSQ